MAALRLCFLTSKVALVVMLVAIPSLVFAVQPGQPKKTVTVPTPKPLGQPKAVGDAATAAQCSRHMNGKTQVTKCDKAISSNKLVLIWSFSTGGGPRPAGFNVLRNGNLAVTDIDPKSTGYIMPQTLDTAAGNCYAIQAYTTKPAATGKPSKTYCVVAPTVLSPAHVNPSYVMNTKGSRKCNKTFPHSYGPGAPNQPHGWYSFNDNQGNTDIYSGDPIVNRGEILVGYSHTNNPGGCGTNVSYIHYRSALWFNLSGVSAANFLRATLSLRVAHAWADVYKGSETKLPTTTQNFGSGGEPEYIWTETKNDDSCASGIGYAVNKIWMNSVSKTSLIDFDPAVKVGASTGTISVDVTTMVKTWLSGARSNNGFVLLAHDPAPKKLSNIECLTQYDTAKLTLEYR